MDRQEAVAELRELVKPGSTVRPILRHVSRSGMFRCISVVIPFTRDDGTPGIRDISYLTALATGRKLSRLHDGIECHGCGMDMGFDLAYSLSVALYGEGYGEGPGYDCLAYAPDGTALNGRCPSNHHGNGGKVGPGWDYHHTDGYAVSQSWL